MIQGQVAAGAGGTHSQQKGLESKLRSSASDFPGGQWLRICLPLRGTWV